MDRNDLVRREDVMQALLAEYNRRFMAGDRGGLKLAWIEKAVNSVPPAVNAAGEEQATCGCGPDYCEIGGTH
jgi:hypothetical protein